MLNSSIETLVSLYSEEQSAGSPYNTGDGALSTGLADKVSTSESLAPICIRKSSSQTCIALKALVLDRRRYRDDRSSTIHG